MLLVLGLLALGKFNQPCTSMDADTTASVVAKGDGPFGSAECQAGRHSFVSIRNDVEDAIHCSDTDFVTNCIDNPATCTAKTPERTEFIALGCGVIQKHAIRMRRVWQCTEDVLFDQFSAYFEDVKSEALCGKVKDLDKDAHDRIVRSMMQNYKATYSDYRSRLAKAATSAMAYADTNKLPLDDALQYFRDKIVSYKATSPQDPYDSYRHSWQPYLLANDQNPDVDLEFGLIQAVLAALGDIAGSVPEVFETCVESLDDLMALKCNPTMGRSVGFSPPLIDDKEVTGFNLCGSYSLSAHVNAHPAFIRMAIDELIPTFQPRQLDFTTGFTNYVKLKVKSKISGRYSERYVPSQCRDVKAAGICWVFSGCVNLMATNMQKAFVKHMSYSSKKQTKQPVQ